MNGFILFLLLLFTLVPIIGFWVLFKKAGRPGWASIIPIYNTITLLRIGGKPWWWIFLLCIPIVDIVLLIILYINIARNFGKGGGFAVGLVFLPFIFFLILAFSDAKYQPVLQEK